MKEWKSPDSSAPGQQGILYLAGLKEGGNDRLCEAEITGFCFGIIPGLEVMAVRADILNQVRRFIRMAGKGNGQSDLG